MNKFLLTTMLFLFSTASWAVQDDNIRVLLEEPSSNRVASGVSNLRGWAVAPNGIDRVELFINDEYIDDIPYGSIRTDVGAIFPDIPDSENSGFSMAWAYGSLALGSNHITVVAYDALGNFNITATDFQVEKFDSDYIINSNQVDLRTAAMRPLDNNRLIMEGATVEGQEWDIELKWQRSTQGFDINLIEPINNPPPTPGVTPGRWEGPGVCFFVSTDGQTITSVGSTCDKGLAADSDVNGLNNDFSSCDAEVECTGIWSIVEGTFSCTSGNTLIVGTFDGNEASGLAAEPEGGIGDFCVGVWSATPD